MTKTIPEIKDLQASVLRKCKESADTKEQFFLENTDKIIECCKTMTEAFAKGATLFTMGNGGSSCDAQHIAVEFMHPVLEKRVGLPAMALSTDSAFLSAVSNDEDFQFTFSKQLQLLAKPGDMALAISTSGKSSSIVRALKMAKEKSLLTIGFSGRDGGRLPELCDFCFTVPNFSIHRIQETHETLLHILWDTIHLLRGEEDVL